MTAVRSRSASLWRQPDFMKLWLGQTISELGSRITRDGLPFVALLVLNATPSQMGVITAAGSLAVLLTGMPAGVWVDRLRRRPLLIAADIGRALIIASVPFAAFTHQLRIEQLYLVVALNGALTVLFDAAYEAYLPTLIDRTQLVDGNSKLQFSDSTAEVLGPGLAGFLVQALTAPIAMAFDALSFLASIISLWFIRQPEARPTSHTSQPHVWHEMIDGVRYVWGDARLRALALSGGTRSFFGNFIGVLYALFAVRELGLGAAALGLTVAVGGVGGLWGAAVTTRVTQRWGVGRTLLVTQIVASLFTFFIPLAGGSWVTATLMLMTAQLIGDGLSTIGGINQVSLRQAITPDHLRGRVSSSLSWLVAGIGPIGALIGGGLAETIGPRPTLLIAAIGILLSNVWLLSSPLRHVQNHALSDGTPVV
ncbi:MAG: MFS transporter [Anaerolineae bacterium]